VKVTNPALFDKPIVSPRADILAQFGFKVTRSLEDGRLIPITPETTFKYGQVLLIVGDSRNSEAAIDYFGEAYDSTGWHDDELVSTRETFVVTAPTVIGKTLAELDLFKSHGVLVTRMGRIGGEFVPNARTTLEYADQVTVVGVSDSLVAFSRFVGHREKALQETDLYSLAGGVLFGIFVGLIPLSLPGTDPIHLGLAGGTLVVSLLLGHFGRIGRIVGRVPLAAQQVLREVGLVLFLAEAGVDAGGEFVHIIQQYGLVLFIVSIFTTVIPLILGYSIGRSLLKIPVLETLGGLCGAMTSTPALGAMTNAVDSTVPMVSYATAYPVALVFKIAAIQLLVLIMGVFS
jgi:putative transport protein